MDIPIVEQVKIQARVLVPLVKTMQAELGEQRANDLVRTGLAEFARTVGEAIGSASSGTSIEKIAAFLPRFAAGDALDLEVLQRSKNVFDFNVTGCRYAKFFHEIGAPELGFLLACNLDRDITEAVGLDVEFNRTQTIMQGAKYWDFRFRRKQLGS